MLPGELNCGDTEPRSGVSTREKGVENQGHRRRKDRRRVGNSQGPEAGGRELFILREQICTTHRAPTITVQQAAGK